MSTLPILIAIPQDTEEEMLTSRIRNEGFSVIVSHFYEKALNIVRTQELLAVVMFSEWALPQDNGKVGLMGFLKNKTPTVSLIADKTYSKDASWFDKLYDRPRHEYQHLPADIDAILIALKNGIVAFQK